MFDPPPPYVSPPPYESPPPYDPNPPMTGFASPSWSHMNQPLPGHPSVNQVVPSVPSGWNPVMTVCPHCRQSVSHTINKNF